MNFIIKKNQPNKNIITIHKDNSFGVIDDFDYQISLGNLPFILNFKDNYCIGCEGYLNNLNNSNLNFILSKLTQAPKIGLFCSNYNVGDYGENIEFKNEIQFDNNLKILLVGEWSNIGEIYNFGINQYLNFNNEKIAGFLIKFELGN